MSVSIRKNLTFKVGDTIVVRRIIKDNGWVPAPSNLIGKSFIAIDKDNVGGCPCYRVRNGTSNWYLLQDEVELFVEPIGLAKEIHDLETMGYRYD